MNAAGSEQRQPLVLTIDDETAIRESFRNFLEDYDYRVIEAENGRKGIEAFHARRPDLVLVDLRMPEVDGLEVLSEITEKSPETPVIVISGTGYIKDAIEALRLGAWDYLLKPIEELSVLKHAIDKSLERARLIRENRSYQAHLEAEVASRTRALENTNQKLMQSEKKARKLAAELEKRVAERTHDLVKANADLQKAKKRADAAASSKSYFLANMSHEIRTPLNGVIATAELALQEDMSPNLRKNLTIIHQSGYILSHIINDILDFSKIEAGKLELETKPFHLAEVIDNTIVLSANEIMEKEIELLVDIEPDIPTVFCGDSLRIQQILTNLVNNAVKFTDENGIVTISVSEIKNALHPGGTVLKCCVRDTGIGMTPEQVSRLFTPFSQADSSTTRNYGGTGLGLSICKNLTRMMGGNIWVESVLHEGSAFYFTIMLKNGPEKLKHSLTVPPSISSLKVLVADDCRETQKLLSKILTSFGFKAVTASSGAEAANMLKSDNDSFDLLMIDWMMPGEDGPETIRRIQKEYKKKLPVIMMSAYGKKLQLNRSHGIRISGFLSKPFYSSSLLDAIMDVFSQDKNNESQNFSDEQPPADLSPHRKRVRGMRILLAEDNLTNQEIATAILKNGGVSVDIVNNGSDALEAVKKKQYDAVLMDIQMPVMDGFEATRRIRRNENQHTPVFHSGKKGQLPIIAMTAHAMKGDREKCLEAGMNGYVTKPINQETLFKVLSEKAGRPHLQAAIHSRPQFAPPLPETDTVNPEAELPDSVPGLDIKEALDALQVKPKIYLNVLDLFCQSNKETAKKMRRMHRQKSWDELRKLAHTIKGSAANIRANDLKKYALAVEMAARKALDEENAGTDVLLSDSEIPDPALIDRLEKELALVTASVNILNQSPSENGDQPSSEAADSAMKALYNALRQSDPWKVVHRLDMLSPHLETSARQTLRYCVARYDYRKAIAELQKIAREMSIDLDS